MTAQSDDESSGAAEAFRRHGGASGLMELREIQARRAQLDADELALIDRARRAGSTWPAIAAALGLSSRQAAEQRRHRLAQAAERDSRPQRAELDQGYGETLAALRKSAVDLHLRIGADRRWDARFPRAALVRETLSAAPDAPPGALYDLVAEALADLSTHPLPHPPTMPTGSAALPADPAAGSTVSPAGSAARSAGAGGTRGGRVQGLPVPLRAAVGRLRARFEEARPG
ncbi:hypothetical protein [Actinoplanes palleronii]|nr:hypothetical protein [Actinoplanes palleronii]